MPSYHHALFHLFSYIQSPPKESIHFVEKELSTQNTEDPDPFQEVYQLDRKYGRPPRIIPDPLVFEYWASFQEFAQYY